MNAKGVRRWIKKNAPEYRLVRSAYIDQLQSERFDPDLVDELDLESFEILSDEVEALRGLLDQLTRERDALVAERDGLVIARQSLRDRLDRDQAGPSPWAPS